MSAYSYAQKKQHIATALERASSFAGKKFVDGEIKAFVKEELVEGLATAALEIAMGAVSL